MDPNTTITPIPTPYLTIFLSPYPQTHFNICQDENCGLTNDIYSVQYITYGFEDCMQKYRYIFLILLLIVLYVINSASITINKESGELSYNHTALSIFISDLDSVSPVPIPDTTNLHIVSIFI